MSSILVRIESVFYVLIGFIVNNDFKHNYRYYYNLTEGLQQLQHILSFLSN